jgi:hypothetical protein
MTKQEETIDFIFFLSQPKAESRVFRSGRIRKRSPDDGTISCG